LYRESGGAFGKRQAAKEEEYFRQLVIVSSILNLTKFTWHQVIGMIQLLRLQDETLVLSLHWQIAVT
jgi:Mitochondrial ATPase inhibitor, IATP